MRNKHNKLQQEVTALDLAVKMLRAENEGMRRSVVTLKKALQAPLALWESHWFESLPKAEQELIDKAARTIASAFKPVPPTVIHQTVTSNTSATPVKAISKTVVKPVKKTRKRSSTKNSNARWTASDDKNLMRMVKAKETKTHMAMVMGRSVSAVEQRIKILKAGK